MGGPKPNGEQTPLLAESRDVERSAPTGATNRLKARVIGTLSLIIVIYSIGSVTFTVPLNSLLEEHICKQRFGDLAGNLERCKNDDKVSARLAYIDGWNGTLALLPALVFSVPYGLLADKWGRRKTFFLTNVGLALFLAHSAVVVSFLDYIDIRWIWASGLWFVIGGGLPVLTATIFAFVSDVTEPETRSQSFFFIGSCQLMAQIVGPPIAYVTVGYGRWFSLWLGLALVSSIVPISTLLPETKNTPGHNLRPMVAEELQAPTKDTLQDKIRAMGREAKSIALYQFLENKLLGLSLFSLIFTSFSRMLPPLLEKYARRRFGWSWSEVGLLSSARAFVALGTTAIVLPAADAYMRKTLKIPLIKKDMWLVRVNILFMMVGATCIGLAPTKALLLTSLTIMSLGIGYELAMRGMLAQVAGDRVATVYTTMSLMETIGELISGPLLAKLYRVGLGLGMEWSGLPFLASGGLFFIAALIVWCVRYRDIDQAEDEASQD